MSKKKGGQCGGARPKSANACFDTAKNPEFRTTPVPPDKVKKLFNYMEYAVDESLAGMVLFNNGLIMMGGHRVILRRDYLMLSDQVKLLSGGGAGHEPSHIGFVGPGMLTGAVCGDLFKPPSTTDILAAIRALSTNDKAGVLVIVKNYVNERINFALAVERAKILGINVKLVIVGEDIGGSSLDRTSGRRGLAGILLIQKIAGAMAEERKTLGEIHSMCELLVANMATISVTLESFTAPDIPKATLRNGEFEVGQGIHAEPGCKKIPFGTSATIAKKMLDLLLGSEETESHVSIVAGDELVLLINNFGGSTKLEEMIFAKDVMLQLRKKGHSVVRAYCGTLLTSLDMAGFSITIMKMVVEILRYLDAPTMAPSWPKHFRMFSKSGRIMPSKVNALKTEAHRNLDKETARISEEASQILFLALNYSATWLSQSEKLLNKYDKEFGDGTFGTRIKGTAERILEVVGQEGLDTSSPFLVFQKLSEVMDGLGGSSGSLYGLFFMAASRIFVNQSEVNPRTWIAALRAGTDALRKYGGADLGDRTMVDVLVSMTDAFENMYLRRPKKPLEALEYATETAEMTAARTASMKPRSGKACYAFNTKASKSKTKMDTPQFPDPGAHAVGIWVRAVCEAIKYKLGEVET